ncbi:hypothetical protein CDQ91_10195 [Sphingopyxis witflariensis]|uniref:Uncharacterized protein n=2 Tax=Sphingopyxis witflariensis TaxID=173675 RepID=A0A246JY07_9SPHN|nr:hypothetical protein CDQ91_10195 [Sphingopyxis witflariensis]
MLGLMKIEDHSRIKLKNDGLEADKRRLNAKIEELTTKNGKQAVEIARLLPDAEAHRAKKAKDAAYEATRVRPSRAKSSAQASNDAAPKAKKGVRS